MTPQENENIAVIVPAYNEPNISKTLYGLYTQKVRPEGTHHFVVDNGSTDNTRDQINAFIYEHADFPLTVLEEAEKGTGAAVDTGFRTAIHQGYSLLARTDSDTVPTPLWTSRIVYTFSADQNIQLLGGTSSPLKDEQYRVGDRLLLPAAIKAARIALSLKNFNTEYLKAVVGHNMATRSDAYVDVGGFERSSIDRMDEDIDYSLKIAGRYGADAIKIDQRIEVETSMRRIRRYGIGGTALHHLFPGLRKYRKNGVDVR